LYKFPAKPPYHINEIQGLYIYDFAVKGLG